ncbi:MAG: hypothetical protein KC933_42970, partial [Myxococcales bacterium]|nr:hypothetical protein [Myxococcales bacterium]
EAAGLTATLAPQSTLQIPDIEAMDPVHGAIRVVAEAPASLTHPGARVRGRGDFEIADGDSERGRMISKRGAAGAAVVVVAVYAGWATLATDTAQVEGKAPVGLAADGQGRVSSFPLGEGAAGEVADGASVGHGVAALAAAEAEAEADDASAGPTGAYWSEEAQSVRVALAGEVIDATSG